MILARLDGSHETYTFSTQIKSHRDLRVILDDSPGPLWLEIGTIRFLHGGRCRFWRQEGNF